MAATEADDEYRAALESSSAESEWGDPPVLFAGVSPRHRQRTQITRRLIAKKRRAPRSTLLRKIGLPSSSSIQQRVRATGHAIISCKGQVQLLDAEEDDDGGAFQSPVANSSSSSGWNVKVVQLLAAENQRLRRDMKQLINHVLNLKGSEEGQGAHGMTTAAADTSLSETKAMAADIGAIEGSVDGLVAGEETGGRMDGYAESGKVNGLYSAATALVEGCSPLMHQFETETQAVTRSTERMETDGVRSKLHDATFALTTPILGAPRSDMAAFISRVLTHNASLRDAVSSLTESSSIQLREAQQEIDRLHAELALAKGQCDRALAASQADKKRANTATQQLEELKSHIRARNEAQLEVTNLKLALLQAEEKFLSHQQQSAATIRELETKNSHLEAEVAERRSRRRSSVPSASADWTLEERLDTAEAQLQEVFASRDSMQRERDDLRQQREDTMKLLADYSHQLEVTHRENVNLRGQLSITLASLDGRESSEAELRLTLMVESYKAEAEELRKVVDHQAAALTKQKECLADLDKKYNQLDEQLRQRQADRLALMEDHKLHMARLRQAIGLWKSRCEAAQRKTKFLESTNEKVSYNSNGASVNESEERHSTTASTSITVSDTVSVRPDEELAQLQARHIEEQRALQEANRQAVQEVVDRYETLIAEMRQFQVAKVQGLVETYESELRTAKLNCATALAECEDRRRDAVQKERAAAKVELGKLNEEFKQSICDAMQARDVELETVRAQLQKCEADAAQNVALLRTEHSAAVSALKQAHQSQIQDLVAAHEAAKAMQQQTYESEVKALEATVAELKQQLADLLDGNTARVQREVTLVTARAENAENEVRALQEALRERGRVIIAVKQEAAEAIAEYKSKLEESTVLHTQEVTRLQQQLVQMTVTVQEAEDKSAEFKEAIENIEALQSEIACLRRDRDNELEQYKSHIDLLENRIATLKAISEQAADNAEINSVPMRVETRELEGIKATLQATEDTLHETRQCLHSEQIKFLELKNSLTNAQQERLVLQSRVISLEGECANLRYLQDKYKNLREVVFEAFEELAAGLQEDATPVSVSPLALERSLETPLPPLLQVVGKAKKKLLQYTSQCQTLQAEISAARGVLNDVPCADFQIELLQSKVTSLTEECNLAKDALARKDKYIHELREQARHELSADQSKQVAELQQHVQSLLAEVDQLTNRNVTYEQQLKALRHKVKLEQEIAAQNIAMREKLAEQLRESHQYAAQYLLSRANGEITVLTCTHPARASADDCIPRADGLVAESEHSTTVAGSAVALRPTVGSSGAEYCICCDQHRLGLDLLRRMVRANRLQRQEIEALMDQCRESPMTQLGALETLASQAEEMKDQLAAFERMLAIAHENRDLWENSTGAVEAILERNEELGTLLQTSETALLFQSSKTKKSVHHTENHYQSCAGGSSPWRKSTPRPATTSTSASTLASESPRQQTSYTVDATAAQRSAKRARQ